MKSKISVLLVVMLICLTACININITVPEKNVAENYIEEAPVKEDIEKEKPASDNVNIISQLSDSERREVNIFLSNFSEAYYEPGNYYGEVESKISFAYIHASINYDNMTFYDDGYMGLSAANVDSILTRFFGSSVPHKTPENNKYWFYKNGNFLVPAASGESYSHFSIATSMIKRQDGNFDVQFNVYSDPSVLGGDIISDKTVYYLKDSEASAKYDFVQSGVAVLKPKMLNGKNTYEVVSYSVQ